jgi:hypothetical protein
MTILAKMNNRFIKALIILNGLILPIFICFLIYKNFSKPSDGIDYEAESIIVGEQLDKAKGDSLALQGISYDAPQEIYNSTNFYLPISVLTYEEAKEIKKIAESAGDINLSYLNYFNIVFLDKDYKVIGQLLDKKASIIELYINRGRYDYRDGAVDKTVKHIAYSIGFDDTNKDGKLNSLDAHDLFISDLEGMNLTQVTRGKEIVAFEFINSNSEIFIRFKDRNEIKDEYKYVKFGIYNIASGTFNELKDIEAKLLDIEAKLIK